MQFYIDWIWQEPILIISEGIKWYINGVLYLLRPKFHLKVTGDNFRITDDPINYYYCALYN